nr:MAG TPA: Poxvirus A21 Protein [Bacteriophage sp.]
MVVIVCIIKVLVVFLNICYYILLYNIVFTFYKKRYS